MLIIGVAFGVIVLASSVAPPPAQVAYRRTSRRVLWKSDFHNLREAEEECKTEAHK